MIAIHPWISLWCVVYPSWLQGMRVCYLFRQYNDIHLLALEKYACSSGASPYILMSVDVELMVCHAIYKVASLQMEQSLTWMGISGFSQKKLTFYLRDKGQAWSNLDSPLHKLPTSLRSTRPR